MRRGTLRDRMCPASLRRRSLVAVCELPRPPQRSRRLTFTKDIAPIVFARCAPCHRPGEIGPFSLLSYRDVSQRLSQIADVTARRVMPPWKPEPAAAGAVRRRAIAQRRRAPHAAGLDCSGGARRRSRATSRRRPRRVTAGSSARPTSIVTMSEPYRAAGGWRRCVPHVRPADPDDAARYVRAIEFRPGNARAVHHANLGVDRTRSSRRLDQLDPAPGYSGGMVPEAGYPPGHMLGWTPGQRPRPSPDGMAWRLERGSDLVVQLHMQPTGKPEPVQVSVGLFFTDETPRPRAGRAPARAARRSTSPPATRNHVVSDSYVVPVDVELLAIQPHAHNLARRMEAVATLPDGTTPAADRDRRLGFPLAGRLSLRAADRPAEGHDDPHAVRLRQLGRQPAQSASPAPADRLGAEHVRRDGRSLAAAGAAIDGRLRGAERRMSTASGAMKISRRTRSSSARIRAIRCAGMRWRCCISRAAAGRRRPRSFEDR